jgi:carbon-monoxide dehydrogenase small subunit
MSGSKNNMLDRTHVTSVKSNAARVTEKSSPRVLRIRINGAWYEFAVGQDIQPSHTLAYILREKLGLTGLKTGCDEGACGACTVIMDRKAVLSCMILAVEADGCDILTIEGLEKDDPLVEAFAKQCEPGYGTALQCGFCTPGFVMTAKALLLENPTPTVEEIKEALSGNICRCGCYPAIVEAVLHAVDKTRVERR